MNTTSTPTATPLPLDFLRALAAQLRGPGPQSADARRLLRLIRLHRHLAVEADGPDGQLAEGLAASLLPAIAAFSNTAEAQATIRAVPMSSQRCGRAQLDRRPFPCLAHRVRGPVRPG